jgi:hypothetical protein
VARAAALEAAIRRNHCTRQAQSAVDHLGRAQSALLAGMGSSQISAVGQHVRILTATGEATPAQLQASLTPLGSHEIFLPVLAAATPVELTRALSTAADVLAKAERVVVADTVEETLLSLYHHVERVDTDAGTGFTAQRGSEVIVLGVADGGLITSDQVGAVDCRANHDAIIRGMRKRGVEVSDSEEEPHDPHHDGALIRRARARDANSLARGAAKAVAPRKSWLTETDSTAVGRQVAQ